MSCAEFPEQLLAVDASPADLTQILEKANEFSAVMKVTLVGKIIACTSSQGGSNSAINLLRGAFWRCLAGLQLGIVCEKSALVSRER